MTTATDNAAICQQIREEKARRDDEICRLLAQDWTQRQVAMHMRLGSSTVYAVARARGLTPFKPVAAKQVETVGLQDAPIEAWRQAMMPELEKAAAEQAERGSPLFRAIIVLMLLHLKDTTLRRRCAWLHKLTGYRIDELIAFLIRARRAGILDEDGSIQSVPEDEVAGTIEIVMDAMVLAGELRRTPDGKYSIGDLLN